jgi:predicted transcriptional regulator
MSVEVLEPNTRTLREIAGEVARLHAAGCVSMSATLQYWLDAGTLLIEARKQVKPGKWTEWLIENLEVPPGTAKFYVRMATYRELLEAEGITSIEQARNYIRGLPAIDRVSRRVATPELTAEARRLRDADLSFGQIGDLLGVSATTVQKWLDPDLVRRQQEATKRWKQRKKEEVEALQRQRRDAAVRKAGGAIAESYSLLRRTAGARSGRQRSRQPRSTRCGQGGSREDLQRGR